MSSSYPHKGGKMGKNLIKVTGFRFTDQTIPKKIDIIAINQKRNRNQQVEWILSQFIEEYEKQNGEIKINDL